MFNISILFNLSLLISISIVSGFIDRRWNRHSLNGKIIQGLLFGATALIGMYYPYVMQPGLFFDGRTIVISTCTLFYGPITGAISAVGPFIYRIYVGGPGAIAGVGSILAAFIIGYIFYRIKSKSSKHKQWATVWHLYQFGFIVHFTMLMLMFTLPGKIAKEVLITLGLTIIGAYPIFTVLLGKILADHESLETFISNLMKSELLFKQLFHQHSAIKLLVDANDRRIIDANNSAVDFYALPQSTLKQMRYDDLLGIEINTAEINRLLSQNKHETIHKISNGSQKDVSVMSAMIDIESQKIYHLIISDISEHVKAQKDKQKLIQQLNLAQKMEAIGHLAAGIAHDFNNILSATIGFAYVIKTKVPKDSPLIDYAEQIISAGQRGAGLTQQILAFGRKQILKTIVLNINDNLKQLEKMLRHLLKENIELVLTLYETPLFIKADPTQIDQIIINLAINAQDAMPSGGKLYIATDLFTVKQSSSQLEAFLPVGNYALILVSDSGVGMDEHTASHIFDPFFTTKEVGKGTGLGLSVVYGIVKQHDGYINVYSEPNQGTTFKIYFPLQESSQSHSPEPPNEATYGPMSNNETILIAEDDEPLRNFITTVLKDEGYNVIVAQNGLDAVDKFQSAKDTIKLILIDAIMPKLNGIQAIEKIREIDKTVKIIIMSGYVADIIGNNEPYKHCCTFLQKPLTPSSLLGTIKKVLDGKI